MGNPSTIAFVNLENRLYLPSNDEFAKVEYVIGEFLQPLSTELLSLAEIEGSSVLTTSAKDFAYPSLTIKPMETQEAIPKVSSLPSTTDFSLEVQQIAEGLNPKISTVRIKRK